MYRIRNWEKHFETHETKKLKRLLWVKVPNQQDGLSYRRLAAREDGANIFAAWILMVQVASKQANRGNLPFSPDELGIVTGFPGDLFRKAIEVLKSPEIGWIEQFPVTSGDSPDASGNSPASPPIDGREGREGREESETRAREGETQPPDQGEFQAWKTAVLSAFRWTPKSVGDERRLWDAVEEFRAKGSIADMQRAAAAAWEQWEPRMVTPRGVAGQMEALLRPAKPKGKSPAPVEVEFYEKPAEFAEPPQ